MDVDHILGSIRLSSQWAPIQSTAARLKLEMKPSAEQLLPTSAFAYKYLDCEFWIRKNITRAIALELHQKRGLSILDIGTGTGYFPMVCRHLGHTVTCTEVQNLTGEGAEIYPAMSRAAGVLSTVSLDIHQPRLDIDGCFDLICAYMICFGRDWEPSAWRKFICKAKDRLKPMGRLFFHFNCDFSPNLKTTLEDLGTVTADTVYVERR